MAMRPPVYVMGLSFYSVAGFKRPFHKYYG